jgi:hypothetical protein
MATEIETSSFIFNLELQKRYYWNVCFYILKNDFFKIHIFLYFNILILKIIFK